MQTNFDTAASITVFLMENTGTCQGVWWGRLKKTEQIRILGQYFGKGLLCIDGGREVIEHHVKVCFGTDTDVTKRAKFGQ